MAERRMLAKSIIESDMFTDMPTEAQMLYVRLILAADDDGFVSNPRTIMRGCGASNDSMKLLIEKKFVLSFLKGDNFVYLIKHWRIHNYIRTDRYKASTFKELLRGVYYDENKAYSTTDGEGKMPVLPCRDTSGIPDGPDLDTDGIPDDIPAVDECETQVRLGKVSLSKVSLETGEERKGESEGETQMDLLSAEEKKERIRFWRGRIDFMRQQNFDPGCMYDLARAEGITAQEIDNFKEET